MFRITARSICTQASLHHLPSQERELNRKLESLISHIGAGFNLHQPPEHVVYYRSSRLLQEDQDFIGAQRMLSQALESAKWHQADETVTQLYTKELQAVEETLRDMQIFHQRRVERDSLKRKLMLGLSVGASALAYGIGRYENVH